MGGDLVDGSGGFDHADEDDTPDDDEGTPGVEARV
jgi:hypothetical protein